MHNRHTHCHAHCKNRHTPWHPLPPSSPGDSGAFSFISFPRGDRERQRIKPKVAVMPFMGFNLLPRCFVLSITFVENLALEKTNPVWFLLNLFQGLAKLGNQRLFFHYCCRRFSSRIWALIVTVYPSIMLWLYTVTYWLWYTNTTGKLYNDKFNLHF